MHPDGRSRTRRIVAASAVLTVHLLLLLLLRDSRDNRTTASIDAASAPSVLVWLDDSAQATRPRDSTGAGDAPPANKVMRRRRPAAVNAVPTDAGAQAGTTHDWYGAVDDLARGPAGAVKPRPFGQMPPPRRPCAAPSKPFEWSPEPRRAGLAGGLPYVRMGRCVVGLGFFGCRMGGAPPPNGRLLEGMKEAPVVPGSVPDDRDCAR